jgi:hypothetical protein
MSKKIALLLALAATLATGTASAAREFSFAVENKTGYTLVGLYGSPSSETEWGANFLSGSIKTGNTVTISGKVEECLQDFRYEFDGMESYDEYKIDVCQISGETYTIE